MSLAMNTNTFLSGAHIRAPARRRSSDGSEKKALEVSSSLAFYSHPRIQVAESKAAARMANQTLSKSIGSVARSSDVITKSEMQPLRGDDQASRVAAAAGGNAAAGAASAINNHSLLLKGIAGSDIIQNFSDLWRVFGS